MTPIAPQSRDESSMRLRHVYLVLCVLGIVLPYWEFVPWLASHGLDLRLFISELFSTRIGAFFGFDVIVSALVLLVFIAVERRRLAIRTWWIAVLGILVVGVSLGFPLFLYLRQVKLETQANSPGPST
jgi:hypothetical protein